MPAAITDKISRVSSGVRPVSTTVSIGRNAGNTTLACADLTGWTTTEKVHFVTYKIDGQSKVIAGTQSDWTGIVSGSNINNLTLTGGSDNGNAAGDIVELLPTAQYGKDLADHILTSHNQDGTLKTGVVGAGQLAANSVTPAAMDTNTNVETRQSESVGNIIASGLVWTLSSGLIASMSAGIVYINGKRISIATVASKTFTASKDTYIAVDASGVITYNETTNGGAAPAAPANSVWIARVITGAAAITTVDMYGVVGTTVIAPKPVGMKYTEPNGWTVVELNKARRYFKQFAFSASITGGSTGFAVTSANYPVGITFQDVIHSSTLQRSGNAADMITNVEVGSNTATAFAVTARNFAATQNGNGNVFIELTTK